MALSRDMIQSAYPLPVFNYKVTIDADILSFSEVSGLGIEYDKIIYKHGFSYLTGPHIIRGQHNPVNVTLKRGIVSKRNGLYVWLNEKLKKNIYIDLCDEKGSAVVRWKVIKAMPFKITAPSFVASANEVAIESVDLIAHDLVIEYL